MIKFCVSVLSVLLMASSLTGCGSESKNSSVFRAPRLIAPKTAFVAKKEPWRRVEERQCLASGMVRKTSFLTPRSALKGPETCGALRPFSMRGALGGKIALKPAALLRCPMVPAVDRWLSEIVNPAARAHFGQNVVEIKVAASYACRPINNRRGGKLSEHGYANALDVSKFILANGRVVTVKAGWWGRRSESLFLRKVHKQACSIFYTVLGPNYNKLHHDHFHLDLARHGRKGTYRVCK